MARSGYTSGVGGRRRGRDRAAEVQRSAMALGQVRGFCADRTDGSMETMQGWGLVRPRGSKDACSRFWENFSVGSTGETCVNVSWNLLMMRRGVNLQRKWEPGHRGAQAIPFIRTFRTRLQRLLVGCSYSKRVYFRMRTATRQTVGCRLGPSAHAARDARLVRKRCRVRNTRE